MKRSSAFLMVLTTIFFTTSIFAQSVDEVIDKHIDAIGGKSNWRKINAMKMEASINVQGNDIPLTIYQVNNKAMKTEINFNGSTNYNIVTTEGGWKYFPIMGQASPEPMPEEELIASKDGLDIQGELLDYKDKGHKAELLGKENMENAEVYKVKLTRKSGSETIFMIDTRNHYIVRSVSKIKINGQEIEQTQSPGSYQKLPEGIVVPFSLEGSGPGIITISKFDINPVIDDSVFKVLQ